MSTLLFDRMGKQLTLVGRDEKEIGSWPAGNNIDSSVGLPHLPAGVYRFQPAGHKRHGAKAGDTTAGSYGPMGIFLLEPFSYKGTWHEGVGVHSGRKNMPDKAGRAGTEHATKLCVRTTDVAMSMIYLTSMNDPLGTLIVRDTIHSRARSRVPRSQS